MKPVPNVSAWRVHDALSWASEQLAATSEAELSAKLLLAHALSCTTTHVFAHPERALTLREAASYRDLVARRARHEPVAYLVGHQAFMDLDLIVDRRVLIPRPETEHLVEQALDMAQRWHAPRLADIGTGSGAIAISIARQCPRAQVFATDASRGALQVAQGNARRHGVAGQILFRQGDLLAPLDAPVHVIVANLPYVSASEFASLPPDIRLYEPREALVSGTDGLDAVRALLDTARPHLTPDGAILLEIGAAQGQPSAALARRAFPGARVSIHPDHARRDRVLCVELAGKDLS